MDENKEILKKYEEVWDRIKKDIETINGGERVEYGKDFKKIRFESNDDLPRNKPIKLRLLAIIIKCVFSEGSKFYPQLFLDKKKHFSVKMLQYEKIDASEGIDVNKTSASKKCELCHYWFFKDIGFKFEEHVCNRCHDLLTMAYSLKNIAMFSAKGATFGCLLLGTSKSEVLKKLNNLVTYDRRVL